MFQKKMEKKEQIIKLLEKQGKVAKSKIGKLTNTHYYLLIKLLEELEKENIIVKVPGEVSHYIYYKIKEGEDEVITKTK